MFRELPILVSLHLVTAVISMYLPNVQLWASSVKFLDGHESLFDKNPSLIVNLGLRKTPVRIQMGTNGPRWGWGFIKNKLSGPHYRDWITQCAQNPFFSPSTTFCPPASPSSSPSPPTSHPTPCLPPPSYKRDVFYWFFLRLPGGTYLASGAPGCCQSPHKLIPKVLTISWRKPGSVMSCT